MEPPDRLREITVLLVDDHRLVREALRDALAREGGVRVVGEAGAGRTAIECVREMRPDVVVLDTALPDLNGIEVAAQVRAVQPDTRVVALSASSNRRVVADMIKAGASGFVSKQAAGAALVTAIRTAAAGGTYLSEDVVGDLVAELREDAEPLECRLGKRETQVLQMLAQGLRSSRIAEAMHISVATVDVHRRNIMRKLDLHSVAELTRYAIREGLVPP